MNEQRNTVLIFKLNSSFLYDKLYCWMHTHNLSSQQLLFLFATAIPHFTTNISSQLFYAFLWFFQGFLYLNFCFSEFFCLFAFMCFLV